jgi:hypothetical protein
VNFLQLNVLFYFFKIELELIQTRMIQKPLLWVEVGEGGGFVAPDVVEELAVQLFYPRTEPFGGYVENAVCWGDCCCVHLRRGRFREEILNVLFHFLKFELELLVAVAVFAVIKEQRATAHFPVRLFIVHFPNS